MFISVTIVMSWFTIIFKQCIIQRQYGVGDLLFFTAYNNLDQFWFL